jgi:hypothetical protein
MTFKWEVIFNQEMSEVQIREWLTEHAGKLEYREFVNQLLRNLNLAREAAIQFKPTWLATEAQKRLLRMENWVAATLYLWPHL